MHQAAIDVDAVIGKGCKINTFANIAHGAVVGDYTHISLGAMVNAGIEIGKWCFIGANSVIAINNVHITDNVVIGAGSVVIRDIVNSGTYVGNPARLLEAVWICYRSYFRAIFVSVFVLKIRF